jgi:hypothetical protein
MVFPRWPSTCVTLTAMLAVLTLTVFPARAHGFSLGVDNTGIECGYDSVSNTFRPVAAVFRDPLFSHADAKVSVRMTLIDPPNPDVNLGTGIVEDGVEQNGAYVVPVGETRHFRPEAGAVFGDGGSGGQALQRDHDYRLRVRMFDFEVADETFSSWTCHTAGRQFQPNPDGYPFQNFGAASGGVAYSSMEADYPASASEMRYPNGTESQKGTDFFNNTFKPSMEGGLCFGFSATSTYLFDVALNPPPYVAFDPSHDPVAGGDGRLSPLPFPFDGHDGQPVLFFIERYHSRQLAELGAYEEFTAQLNKAVSEGNAGVFNDLSTNAQPKPVVLIIVPKDGHESLGHRHAVVAYGTSTSQGNKIYIYDPNKPGNNNVTWTIDPQGGVSADDMTYGSHVVNGTDWGDPQDWQLAVIPDFAWQDDSVETVNSTTIDNRHWYLDAVGNIPYFTNALPATFSGQPVFPTDGPLGNPVSAELTPAGQPFSDRITAYESGAVSGEFAANHVVAATQTEPGASGTTHEMAINADATSISLSDASSQQQYTLTIGADYLPDYGRKFTVSRADLAPASDLTVSTNAGSDALTLAGSGDSETVDLRIAQVGQNESSATVNAVIPGSGVRATITVADWSDVQHSLIYETYVSGGQTKVIVVQDNPAEHQALEGQLFGQLDTTIAGLSNGGIALSLKAKLDAAQKQVARGNDASAINILGALENEIRAQADPKKKVPSGTATSLLTSADLLIGLLRGP